MGVRLDTVSAIPDGIKWSGAAVLLGIAIVAFHYYADHSLLLRVVALLVVVGVATGVALQTEKGRIAWNFVRESRTEVRKVVWPTRKETMQTTGIVVVMVGLVAMILWGLDTFLAWMVRLFLGQGG